MKADRGQASVEMVAAVPALMLAALVALQLLAAGWASALADGAAEAGALAIVAGKAPGPAVRDALPGWARSRVRAESSGGRLTVRLQPPSVVPGLSGRLQVDSTIWVRPGARG